MGQMKRLAPALAEQRPGRGCLPGRAGTPNITQLGRRRQTRDFLVEKDGRTFLVQFAGRNAEALGMLIDAGAVGVTPLDFPAGVRVAAIVHRLKAAGITIDAATEVHDGAHAGWHARYTLAAKVERVEG